MQSIAQTKEALAPRGRPLLVNHWASWCVPCVAEMPLLAASAKRFEGRVDFVGVSWDLFNVSLDQDSRTRVLHQVGGVVKKTDVSYPILIVDGTVEALGEALQLAEFSLPQTFLFDRSGRKIAEFEVIEEGESLQAFEKALAQAAQSP